MKRLRAYLVDDEPLALKRLARLLDETGRVEIVGSSTDPQEAVEQLRTLPCDVLFTDIEMPDLSGFQMLAQLDPQPIVVFTTAYSQYALQAFEVHSIDYLLKPVDMQQLDRALTKLERMRGGLEPKPQLAKLMEELALALPKKKTYSARLPSRLGDRIELVEVARVTHFYANEKLTYASTPKKDFVIDHTITELEQMLDPTKFVRIHRSTVVNLEYVTGLYSWFSERMMVRIKDGKDTELTVARDRVKTLKERLGF
ncbi:MAG: response regulator transcription factor [Acidobacteriaceae bacterium]|nr:response regulator transcription factor [Acidobacteriaceae bacterium]MBV9502271.1 response regulator transcription factor [Acidobacteriaceae bacterium]